MAPMRLCHFSDTHLGFTAYRAATPEGLNQRGEDVAEAFDGAIDILVLRRPDVAIHSGDLFDSPRPSNRAMARAAAGFARLHDAGIPVLLVAGNHEVPLQRDLGSAHAVMARLPGVRAVYQGRYEAWTLRDGLVVHAIPHCLTHEAFQAELATLNPLGGERHVFATHGSVPALPEFRHARGNPQFIDEALFDDSRWDYVALGHYHGATRFREHAWYAGSTDRLDWQEADHVPGVVEYDLAARKATFHPIQGLRPMYDWTLEGVNHFPPGELTDLVCSTIRTAIDKAGELPPVLRIRLLGVDRATWQHVDQRAITAERARACHVEVEPVYPDASAPEADLAADRPAVGSLEAEWRAFALEAGLEPALVDEGVGYLRGGEA